MSFVSRNLTDAERKYAQNEREALTITGACEKFDFYLVRTKFEIETDNERLVKLLGDSDLENLPLRCQRIKLRLMRYSFEIFRTPRPQMFLADLLSRPARKPDEEEIKSALRVEMHMKVIIRAEKWFDDVMVNEIKRIADEDR